MSDDQAAQLPSTAPKRPRSEDSSATDQGAEIAELKELLREQMIAQAEERKLNAERAANQEKAIADQNLSFTNMLKEMAQQALGARAPPAEQVQITPAAVADAQQAIPPTRRLNQLLQTKVAAATEAAEHKLKKLNAAQCAGITLLKVKSKASTDAKDKLPDEFPPLVRAGKPVRLATAGGMPLSILAENQDIIDQKHREYQCVILEQMHLTQTKIAAHVAQDIKDSSMELHAQLTELYSDTKIPKETATADVAQAMENFQTNCDESLKKVELARKEAMIKKKQKREDLAKARFEVLKMEDKKDSILSLLRSEISRDRALQQDQATVMVHDSDGEDDEALLQRLERDDVLVRRLTKVLNKKERKAKVDGSGKKKTQPTNPQKQQQQQTKQPATAHQQQQKGGQSKNGKGHANQPLGVTQGNGKGKKKKK